MQACFMPERGTIEAVFISRRLQEEYQAEGKWESSRQSTEESVVMGNEEERNSRSLGYISDESV